MNSINIFNKEVLDFAKIPVVFLSFDEPNADENFEHLQQNHVAPKNVHRIHGVKGFDAAHKAAAQCAGTSRFFTVDADCIVSPDLWRRTMRIEHIDLNKTFSWSSINAINGLVYGNGGVKLWYADFVKNMRTHEAATDDSTSVEFCWDQQYKQMNTTYGVVYNNASAYQAFRAGFREGVKMGLDQGNKVALDKFKSNMYPANYARWIIWMTIGRDVPNGEWSMYGARMGAYKLYIENFDHSLISNYDWFNDFWDNILIDTENGKCLKEKSNHILNELASKINLPLVELDDKQSIWFKHVNFNPIASQGWPSLLNQSALSLFGFRLP